MRMRGIPFAAKEPDIIDFFQRANVMPMGVSVGTWRGMLAWQALERIQHTVPGFNSSYLEQKALSPAPATLECESSSGRQERLVGAGQALRPSAR